MQSDIALILKYLEGNLLIFCILAKQILKGKVIRLNEIYGQVFITLH